MGRWMKPEDAWGVIDVAICDMLEYSHVNVQILSSVYPLLAAMTFVTSMCVFQLTRNVFLNPDVRINKEKRSMGVLENGEEGEKYAEHGLRKFLRTRPPQIMPAINRFFSDDE